MPALNFDKIFSTMVANGTKRQTIRKPKVPPIVPGDHLVLYTGMRTKDCRKLREADCTQVISLVIEESDIIIKNDFCPIYKTYVYVDGRHLSFEDQLALAAADGFGSVPEFISWFRDFYGLPFIGNIITW